MFNLEHIPNLLQKGINPHTGTYSTYYRLTINLMNNKATLIVHQMRGEEVYYKQHEQQVGDQTFVQTVRDLGTKYRINKENYVVNQQTKT